MGIDAMIYIKTRDGVAPGLEWQLPCNEPEGIMRLTEDDEGLPGATHRVCVPYRYYGPGYERGNWPAISMCLLLLLSCPDVEKVWYGGDYGIEWEYEEDGKTVRAFTADDRAKMDAYYIEHGNRPYK